MKLFIKILFIGIIIFLILFSAVYVFIMLRGRAIITKKLQDLTHNKVSMGYFNINPLLNLEIKKLNIQGLAKVDYISISPSIIGFIMGKIALNNITIIKPELTYERILTKTTDLAAALPSASKAKATPKIKNLIIKRVNLKKGKIDFFDRTVGENGIKITIKDINFSLNNAYIFPHSVITNFQLKGSIPWQQDHEEGKLEAEGWLNLLKKDMQAVLKIEDIDGVYLYPYYSKWVDLEKARIQKAKLNFSSNIQGLNNNLTAQCRLELTDIVRKLRPPEEAQEKAEKITDMVLDTFKTQDQGKIVLDFTIRTKMDRPEFGFGNIKMAVEDKLAQAKSSSGFKTEDILMLPAKLIEGTVKGATDVSKAVIDGTFALSNELKKGIEGSFKKEKKSD